MSQTVVLLLLILGNLILSSGQNVIYHLSDREYARMPPLYHLDHYESCIHEDGGVYCTANFHLVTDQPTPLYTMIQDYSANTATHFNHSQLQYGLCLTKTCKKIYKGGTISDQRSSLEACLNRTLWEHYGLKAKVSDKVTCIKSEQEIELDRYDVIVAVVIALFVVLNFVGSLYEFYHTKKLSPNVAIQENAFNSFSIIRNWKKLISPAASGLESQQTKLKGIHGIRAINTALVLMSHCLLPFVVDVDNPQYIEEVYYNKLYAIIVNGTPTVQTFFVVTGFLLSYNTLLYEEKQKLSWETLPTIIVKRWMRLTTPYVVVLAITATWLRHAGSGPLWESIVNTEVQQCRSNWWLNLLYINNYVDFSSCMTHAWYLAVDLHLYIIGLIIMLSAPRLRTKILTIMMVAGVIIPAAHTYFQDLEATLLISPQSSRTFFVSDRTFHHVYKRSHANLPSYLIGIALGMLVYHWQKTDYQFNKFVKLPLLQWLTFPAMCGLVLLGSAFYPDGPRVSIYLRAAFSGVAKPLFSCMVSFLIIGLVFRFESLYRGILEWEAWTVPSRLSYCAYILHTTYIRYLTGIRTTLVHLSFMLMLEMVISSIIMSYLLAIPLHLLIEAPIQNLVKLFSRRSEKKQSMD